MRLSSLRILKAKTGKINVINLLRLNGGLDRCDFMGFNGLRRGKKMEFEINRHPCLMRKRFQSTEYDGVPGCIQRSSLNESKSGWARRCRL